MRGMIRSWAVKAKQLFHKAKQPTVTPAPVAPKQSEEYLPEQKENEHRRYTWKQKQARPPGHSGRRNGKPTRQGLWDRRFMSRRQRAAHAEGATITTGEFPGIHWPEYKPKMKGTKCQNS